MYVGMKHNPRVWEVTNEPYADEIRFPDGWYWQDEVREFPAGPFSSRGRVLRAADRGCVDY